MAQAAVLKPGQYRHLLRVTRVNSRDPERDTLVLLLGIHTGMRVSEIAQVEVGDFLFPTGAVRQEVSLRAVPASYLEMDTSDPRLINELGAYPPCPSPSTIDGQTCRALSIFFVPQLRLKHPLKYEAVVNPHFAPVALSLGRNFPSNFLWIFFTYKVIIYKFFLSRNNSE